MKSVKKHVFFFMIITFTLVILIANVFVVSVMGTHVYTKQYLVDEAKGISIKTEVLDAQRGNIYGANQTLIATDIKTYNLFAILSPSYRNAFNEEYYVRDKEKTAEILATHLNTTKEYVLNQLNQDLYQVEFGWASRNLSISKKQEIEALNLEGILFNESTTRQYPLGAFASNLIGLASFNDEANRVVGQMGIEASFNAELTGTNGSSTYQHDVHGYILNRNAISEVKPIQGSDIYLTLDQAIQEQLENAFHSVKSEVVAAHHFFGAVMEVETGKIIALGQDPKFDLENIENSSYLNYPFEELLEPGSTFKAITFAAAIDSGNYNGEELFDSGSFYLGLDANGHITKSYNNHNIGYVANAYERDWGLIPFDNAFKYSSNVGTVQLLMKMGEDVFEEYINRFKMTEPITSDRITTPAGHYNYEYPIERANLTFGQGISLTMMNMLQAYTGILNDGIMVKPYFIDKIVNSDDEVIYQGQTQVVGNPIKPSTSAQVRDLMYHCVVDDDGFCRRYAIGSTQVIGKTGTAQIAGESGYQSDNYVHSVVLALPYEDPKVVVYFGYQGPDEVTWLDSKKGIKSLLHLLALKYDPSHQSNHFEAVRQIDIQKIPNLVNHTYDYALMAISSKDFKVVKIGDGDQVIAQAPVAGQMALNNQQLFLLTNDANWLMPDMTGWTIKDITDFWSLTSIEIQTTGSGNVVSQSVHVGESIDKNSQIKVVLK